MFTDQIFGLHLGGETSGSAWKFVEQDKFKASLGNLCSVELTDLKIEVQAGKGSPFFDAVNDAWPNVKKLRNLALSAALDHFRSHQKNFERFLRAVQEEAISGFIESLRDREGATSLTVETGSRGTLLWQKGWGRKAEA